MCVKFSSMYDPSSALSPNTHTLVMIWFFPKIDNWSLKTKIASTPIDRRITEKLQVDFYQEEVKEEGYGPSPNNNTIL